VEFLLKKVRLKLLLHDAEKEKIGLLEFSEFSVKYNDIQSPDVTLQGFDVEISVAGK
jgi:hypothetical protein